MPPLINRDNTCCFSGHRPGKLPWGNNENDPRCLELKDKLFDIVSSLYFSGIRHFICGMALGSDMYFAEAVLSLGERHEDAVLEAAIPCPEQAEHWSGEHRRRYEALLGRCGMRTVVSRSYTPDCMEKRNRYMVDATAHMIAVFNGSPGGTKSTIEYAQRKGLDIILLDPDRMVRKHLRNQ